MKEIKYFTLNYKKAVIKSEIEMYIYSNLRKSPKICKLKYGKNLSLTINYKCHWCLFQY